MLSPDLQFARASNALRNSSRVVSGDSITWYKHGKEIASADADSVFVQVNGDLLEFSRNSYFFQLLFMGKLCRTATDFLSIIRERHALN
ncbi:MAG: hypothetical protein ACXABY_07765 [Candidatus Thorarchaeota archaeon]|jgi:hypothetical protein